MKSTVWVGFVAMVLSFGAFAKDDPVTIDGMHILVTDISENGFGNDKIHSNEMNSKDGVYIIAGSFKQRFPNAEKAIAQIFVSHGIKVSDSLEASSAAISFNTLLALDMAKADQAAAYTSSPNSGQVVAGGGQMLGAVVNGARGAAGGAGGLIGFVAGALFNTDTKLVLSVGVTKDPAIGKVGLFGIVGLKSSSDRIDIDTASIFYRLEKGHEASDDIVLKMAADQWIKHYVIFDSPAMEAATPTAPVIQAAPETSSIVSSSEALNEKK